MPARADALPGELAPPEVLYRLGLLLGAGLFLSEGMGTPWARGVLTLVASVPLATLMVLTLAMQWRVLGDWRRVSQQAVLGGLLVVLTVPFCGLLSPQLGSSVLPSGMEQAMLQFLGGVKSVPGMGALVEILRGLVIFLFYILVMLVLLLTSSPQARVGFTVISIGLVVAMLFLYPAAETVFGLVFLGIFVRTQWEIPVMVPDRLTPHLTAVQLDYLGELVRHGSLSTGETKVYLEQDAGAFAELMDCELVTYEPAQRRALPGQRLMHDPAVATLERVLRIVRRSVWIMVGLAYFVLPDPIPGPIDDFIVLAITSGASVGWLKDLIWGKREPEPTPEPPPGQPERQPERPGEM